VSTSNERDVISEFQMVMREHYDGIAWSTLLILVRTDGEWQIQYVDRVSS